MVTNCFEVLAPMERGAVTESDRLRAQEHAETLVMLEGREARQRADAWERSVKGTAYGVTEPVPAKEVTL